MTELGNPTNPSMKTIFKKETNEYDKVEMQKVIDKLFAANQQLAHQNEEKKKGRQNC